MVTIAAPQIAGAPSASRPGSPSFGSARPADPVAAPQAASSPTSNLAALGDLVGHTINGRYRVEDRIGEGGFGTVYRGVQIQMERECALKVLHPKMARDQQVVGRFRREAQAASVLKDGHTVQIYDFDQTPDGIFFLAMELLHGRSLHHDMNLGPIPVKRVAWILDGIADSLGEAHRHGIVHRDIKPENVFLETRGQDSDFVKVLDFGIAKLTGTSSSEGGVRGPALTAAGQTLGTLEYMSPEQLMGLELDGRSDLYAIGILAYEMLIGELPFVCKTSGEMITAHLKTQPPAPSRTAPELAIPPLVDAVVLRLLEKDRNRRYLSTAELQADLKRVHALLEGDQSMSTPQALAPRTPPVVSVAAPMRRSPARPAPHSSNSNPVNGQLSTRMIVLIVLGIAAFLGILVAARLLVRNAGAAEGSPPPARLVSAAMSAIVSIDVAALRSQSPPAAVAVLEDAARSRFSEVGADPAKTGRIALGIDVGEKDKPPAVLIVDAQVNHDKFEALLKKKLKAGEKIAPASYKGQKYRKGGTEEFAFLPGDRLIVSNGSGLETAVDLGHGVGNALVDGAASKLLERVGAAGGKGPALFAYTAITGDMRHEMQKTAPSAASLEEVAGSLAVLPSGADLKSVGRCGSDAAAKTAATGLRDLVEKAKHDQTVTLLGLIPILNAVKVDSDGPFVQLSLHLTADQYSDLFTRFAGLIASTIDRSPEAAPQDLSEKPNHQKTETQKTETKKMKTKRLKTPAVEGAE